MPTISVDMLFGVLPWVPPSIQNVLYDLYPSHDDIGWVNCIYCMGHTKEYELYHDILDFYSKISLKISVIMDYLKLGQV